MGHNQISEAKQNLRQSFNSEHDVLEVSKVNPMLIMSCNDEPQKIEVENFYEVPQELRKSQELSQDYRHIVSGTHTMNHPETHDKPPAADP